jgi:hypothetical protein
MLSRIPLRWMIRQCFECDTGILFDTAALVEIGLDIYSLWPVCKTATKPPTGPAPGLIDHYETQRLPPLFRRSAFLNFADHDNDEDKHVFHHDHRLAMLPESTEDHFDASAEVNDQLVLAKGWWILEIWPVKVRVLSRDGETWMKKVRLNMGRFRAVRESSPKMHWTVQRMIEDGKYKIRARTEKHCHWEVVA